MKLYCCTRCGSTDVMWDAWVPCNAPDDVRVFDAVFCEGCDGESSVELREVKDEDQDE